MVLIDLKSYLISNRSWSLIENCQWAEFGNQSDQLWVSRADHSDLHGWIR